MTEGILTMSSQEIDRLTVIIQVSEKRLKQKEAMDLLDLSKRQIIRLVKAYRAHGSVALVSKRRGKASNHRHKNSLRIEVNELVAKHYHDFGPTFAAEKLREDHQIDVNKETLRQWMMESGLWNAKRHKKVVVHQSRLRRPCFGELIQIDGSPHDWFEGRAPKCCLLVFIDDATSRLVGLRFEAEETTAGYFKVARSYMEIHGRPLAFYSDKYSVFRVNHPDCEDDETQFGRAMRELSVQLLCASSPQAKGRVERANSTLQNRLVKEMRLKGINTMEAGNAYLPVFMENFNRRFAAEPMSSVDAHRKNLPDEKALDLIFSFQDTRTASKNLELSHHNTVYQIQATGQGYGLRHAKITVCEDLSGAITLLYKGRVLEYKCHKKQKRAPEVVSGKEIDAKIRILKTASPRADHPWRQRRIQPEKNAVYS